MVEHKDGGEGGKIIDLDTERQRRTPPKVESAASDRFDIWGAISHPDSHPDMEKKDTKAKSLASIIAHNFAHVTNYQEAIQSVKEAERMLKDISDELDSGIRPSDRAMRYIEDRLLTITVDGTKYTFALVRVPLTDDLSKLAYMLLPRNENAGSLSVDVDRDT